MATLTSNKTSAGVQPKVLRVGLVAETAVYSLNASLSTGDVLQMIKVPVNARVVDLFVQSIGTGTAAGSFIVGDGVDTDRYMSEVSVASTVVHRMNRAIDPYTYSVDDTIDIVYSLSTVQPSTGSIVMKAWIEYPG